MKALAFVSAIAIAVAFCAHAQVQVAPPAPQLAPQVPVPSISGTTIENPPPMVAVPQPALVTTTTTVASDITVPLSDGNGALLDVLNNIADADFVKSELQFEKESGMGPKGIYRRRLNIIKTLAAKK